MFKDLNLSTVYDSADHHLVDDLMAPLLAESTAYMRGVGYFSSGWLRVAAQGIMGIIENGGKAKFVVSPILDKRDWEAMELGARAKEDNIIRTILEKNIEDLAESLESDTRNCLAWLVSDGLLEFRFALPRDTRSRGDYHDKVGVFTDDNGDKVAIHGSFNDSVKGTLNGEAFSVFCSWKDGHEPYVKQHEERLRALWENSNSQFKVYEIPEASRQGLISLRTSPDRPYSLGKSVELIDFTISNKGPHAPFELYPYQDKAITAWVNAGKTGILDMATGTGKTFTSLAAAAAEYEQAGRLALVILVPYLHLVEQWEEHCKTFGFIPVSCSGEHAGWKVKATSMIQDYCMGSTSNICLIGVHATASLSPFLKIVQKLPTDSTMLIADEAHGLGAHHLKRALFPEAGKRLGLSATPKRWFDEDGTASLFQYFKGVCYSFSLEEAIGKFLVPYEYYPIPIRLDPEENEEYEQLTHRMQILLSNKEKDKKTRSQVERILRERALIVAKASQKLPALISEIQKLLEAYADTGDELRNTLVYCAPGNHKPVLKALAELGLRCREFVHTVNLKERHKVLNQFAAGDIQVLVAIKCLDEGVDVPSTQHAFFLASTTNPREFVQRRGRVLRKSKGKTKAFLRDFIVLPNDSTEASPRDVDRGLLRREMPRFAEFSSAALNCYEARSVVRPLLDQYEMISLLEKKPWDIYHDLLSERNAKGAG